MTLKSLLLLIRIKHWVKNSFIFIPAFFAGNLFEWNTLILLITGFISFSLAASAIYILNDYKDMEEDRNHPDKKVRPLPSGTVKVPIALAIMCIFLLSSIFISYQLSLNFMYIVSSYLLLNIGYSFGLKNISILDIFIVAIGFVLRVLAGGVILDIAISKWLLIMVFLLALFLALAKRLDDLLIFEKSGLNSRKSSTQYNLQFITSGISMLAGIIIVAYLMYTISEEVIERLHSQHLYITSIFIIGGILRYLQISMVEKNSGSPVKILLTDRFIIFCVLGWLVSFFIMIYLGVAI
jgi:decaprenyl-phosphate phosphoribosyltransferase